MKQRLTITRCTLSKDRVNVSRSDNDTFEALLNPTSVSHQMSVTYSQNSASGATSKCVPTRPVGQSAAAPKFGSVNAERIAFELVFDGTGVVRNSPNEVPDVKSDINKLKKIVYRYDGDTHETSVVKIAWGDMPALFGRLTQMSVDYNLFKPSGLPLRARVKLDFVSYMSAVEAAMRAKKSSPDLSHRVQVRDGDTLPLLCQRIYNDPGRYLFVARVNRLANFRGLVPGTWLDFPPLP